MDIAGLSMTLSSMKVQSDVGTAMLGKTLDTNEAMGQSLVNMIDRSSMELSVNPNVGGNIDISV